MTLNHGNLDFLFKRKSKEKLNYVFFKIYTPLLDSRSWLLDFTHGLLDNLRGYIKKLQHYIKNEHFCFKYVFRKVIFSYIIYENNATILYIKKHTLLDVTYKFYIWTNQY